MAKLYPRRKRTVTPPPTGYEPYLLSSGGSFQTAVFEK
jgi:hypothetical protein